jgi:hypothetical protein
MRCPATPGDRRPVLLNDGQRLKDSRPGETLQHAHEPSRYAGRKVDASPCQLPQQVGVHSVLTTKQQIHAAQRFQMTISFESLLCSSEPFRYTSIARPACVAGISSLITNVKPAVAPPVPTVPKQHLSDQSQSNALSSVNHNHNQINHNESSVNHNYIRC